MAFVTWTEELEDQLIALVEERAALWNITLQCYSNRNNKNKLWREIEIKLNVSGKEVRRKWENLRTAYNRYKRPAPSEASGPPTARQQWITSRMGFIEPHTKRKESQSNRTHRENTPQTNLTHRVSNGYVQEMKTMKMENSEKTDICTEASGTDLPLIEPQEGDVSARSVVSPRLSSPPVDITFTVPSADDWGSSGSSLRYSPVLTGEKRKRKRHGTHQDFDPDAGFSIQDKWTAQRAEYGDYFDRYVLHIADFMRTLPPEQCCVFKFQLQKLMFETEQALLAGR